MKFYTKNPRKNHKAFESFVIEKFAWKPICIGNEIRWLEKVKVRGYYWVGAVTGRIYWEWEEFIDEGKPREDDMLYQKATEVFGFNKIND